MFNDQALMWALGFLVIYVGAQLWVSRHPRFAGYSPVKKSLTVKVIALVGFTLAYVLVRMGSGA